MGLNNDNSIDGDVYIQRLSSYIRRNEEALANGLLCFSKNRQPKVKPLRLSFTIHHLYCLTERIETSPLGVDVGPLNIKLDSPNHEPTFISFMANNARSSKHFESDAKSITSINSMKSIVSSASVYWRNFAFSKDPMVVNKDLKYLYLLFTKIPCLILTPKTKINSISGYQEYPCDTSVPVKMFKNLQVLEMIDYDPNEIFGWNVLSEQLRILIIRNLKINDITEVLFALVLDDENGRLSFNTRKKPDIFDHNSSFSDDNNAFKYRRERAMTALALPREFLDLKPERPELPERKWLFLKQLTVSETSITLIPPHAFSPLGNLVKLNLSGNLLDALPDGLDQLVNIKYLNFADNYITNLRNLPRNLKHLLTLNFNNNKLTEIEGIEHLHSLEKIDLRQNSLNELSLLKPLVVQFIKNPDRFTNIYLSGNGLAKGYRTELFNLFNGVKYKNTMKLDDLRPGYFELALLLDAEAAFRALEKYFDLDRRHSVAVPPKATPSAINSLQRHDKKSNISTRGHTRGSKSTSDINDILDPFGSFSLTHRRQTTITTLNTPPMVSPCAFSDTNSIASVSSIKPELPLAVNHSIKNTPVYDEYTTKPMSVLSLLMKRSSTLNQLDLDAINTTAPSVITPVQVHVEGFQ